MAASVSILLDHTSASVNRSVQLNYFLLIRLASPLIYICLSNIFLFVYGLSLSLCLSPSLIICLSIYSSNFLMYISPFPRNFFSLPSFKLNLLCTNSAAPFGVLMNLLVVFLWIWMVCLPCHLDLVCFVLTLGPIVNTLYLSTTKLVKTNNTEKSRCFFYESSKYLVNLGFYAKLLRSSRLSENNVICWGGNSQNKFTTSPQHGSLLFLLPLLSPFCPLPPPLSSQLSLLSFLPHLGA